MNHALNGMEPKVTYIVEVEPGKTRTVFDPEDTQLAKENYRKIKAHGMIGNIMTINEVNSWQASTTKHLIIPSSELMMALIALFRD